MPYLDLESTTLGTVLNLAVKQKVLRMWPKLKVAVPTIFLHKPADLSQHIKTMLSLGINIYQPYLNVHYTKISCCSFNDHELLVQYMEQKQLPYHTFGYPSKRKLKVVIKGLPIDIDLNKVKEELTSLSIPIIRIHKMHHMAFVKQPNLLALAVVPFDYKGKKILQTQKIMGYDVKLEPPKMKSQQCYRCQKWGHSQRYCHGQIKCVKCAGEHEYKKCSRNPEEEPPKCANCQEDHTANYRECPFCPHSKHYKLIQSQKKHEIKKSNNLNPVLITEGNYHKLYKNVEYEDKSPIIIKC